MKVKKLVKRGKVAVLYSPGFGAGWSTWNSSEDVRKMMVFDRDLVNCVLRGEKTEAGRLAQEKAGEKYVCVLGAESLTVGWVLKGLKFEIEEYDGSESICLATERDYLKA